MCTYIIYIRPLKRIQLDASFLSYSLFNGVKRNRSKKVKRNKKKIQPVPGTTSEIFSMVGDHGKLDLYATTMITGNQVFITKVKLDASQLDVSRI